MDTLNQRIRSLPDHAFSLNGISIRPIQNDMDLWFAVVECKLSPEQEEFVNPAGFSIGRAYLHPESNVPCIIWNGNTRIGYIVLREWHSNTANSWSYYLDKSQQHKGYGKTAAMLAVQILQSADPAKPIKLSAEVSNKRAHSLYTSIGFLHTGETDGDDLVYTLPASNPSQP